MTPTPPPFIDEIAPPLAWSDLVFFSIFEMLASPDLDIIFLSPKPPKNNFFFECKYILLLMAFLKFRNSQGA